MSNRYYRSDETDSLCVNAEDKELSAVISFITGKAESAGLSEKRTADLRLCTEEIFGNIIDYAYGDRTGKVTVEVCIDRERNALVIRFTDQGQPFDPFSREAADIPDTVDELSVGGLGIFLTRQLADEMSYEYDNANILTLVMKIKEEIC